MKLVQRLRVRYRIWRNGLGGWGSCYHCGASWLAAEPHTTRISDLEQMFPLCKTCWPTLTIEQRMPHYLAMLARWDKSLPGYGTMRRVMVRLAVEAGL